MLSSFLAGLYPYPLRNHAGCVSVDQAEVYSGDRQTARKTPGSSLTGAECQTPLRPTTKQAHTPYSNISTSTSESCQRPAPERLSKAATKKPERRFRAHLDKMQHPQLPVLRAGASRSQSWCSLNRSARQLFTRKLRLGDYFVQVQSFFLEGKIKVRI